MKALIVTDIHSDYNAARSAYLSERPDLVLDCGDHEEVRNIFELTPHFYIHGNHEPSYIRTGVNEYPLPHKIFQGRIIEFRNDFILKFTGIDGIYSTNADRSFKIEGAALDTLARIREREIDVLLLHQSPFEVERNSPHYKLAVEAMRQIDRINPSFVFAGHSGRYSVSKTPRGTNVVVLDEMSRGYGILNLSSDKSSFQRKLARFG